MTLDIEKYKELNLKFIQHVRKARTENLSDTAIVRLAIEGSAGAPHDHIALQHIVAIMQLSDLLPFETSLSPVEEAVSSSPKTEELGNIVSSTEMDSGAQAQIQKHINETHQ